MPSNAARRRGPPSWTAPPAELDELGAGVPLEHATVTTARTSSAVNSFLLLMGPTSGSRAASSAVRGRERLHGPVADLRAAEQMPTGLSGEVEDEVVRGIRLLEAVEGNAVAAEAHTADPRDGLAGGEAEELPLRPAGGGDLQELLLVVVDEVVALGQHAIQGTTAPQILLVDQGGEVDGDDRLFQDHRPSPDPAQAGDLPHGLLAGGAEGLRDRGARDALGDAEEPRLNRAPGTPSGERGEQPAGPPGLAQDAATGDEGTDALVALHTARALQLVERAAHGDQAHARQPSDLLPAREEVAGLELPLRDQALDEIDHLLVAELRPGRSRVLPRDVADGARARRRHAPSPIRSGRTSRSVSAAAASVRSTSSSVCAVETKRFSNCPGWKSTPRSSMPRQNTVNRSE